MQWNRRRSRRDDPCPPRNACDCFAVMECEAGKGTDRRIGESLIRALSHLSQRIVSCKAVRSRGPRHRPGWAAPHSASLASAEYDFAMTPPAGPPSSAPQTGKAKKPAPARKSLQVDIVNESDD